MTAARTGGGSPPPSDRLLSAKEAADYLGISLKRLYEFCRDGSLRHLRLAETKAGVLRFRRQWLDSWAESKATGGAPPQPPGKPVGRQWPKPPYNTRLRYHVAALFDEQPVMRILTTARTLGEAVTLAAVQTEAKLAIYDTNEGNYLVVWIGTPADARNPMLTAACATCGHPRIEHVGRSDDGGTRCQSPGAGCTCQEFRS